MHRLLKALQTTRLLEVRAQDNWCSNLRSPANKFVNLLQSFPLIPPWQMVRLPSGRGRSDRDTGRLWILSTPWRTQSVLGCLQISLKGLRLIGRSSDLQTLLPCSTTSHISALLVEMLRLSWTKSSRLHRSSSLNTPNSNGSLNMSMKPLPQ
ncbi:hypothetical protein B0H11DRAFT_1983646 [Mycena galericulata]|nr:hypothetical protein B0H11DRAFT_1983646 [Mycena galericulata]